MTRRQWRTLAFGALVLAGGERAEATPADPIVHVLEDRFDGERRLLTIAVERDGDCVTSPELASASPEFALGATGSCAVTLAGPRDATPRLVIARQDGGAARELAIDSIPATAPSASFADRGTTSRAVVLVPARAIPVGGVTTAARLVVTEDGRPTDEVELNIHAAGASVRALRWERPGIAAVDVHVPTWTPQVELFVQREDGEAERAVISVDPGPPEVVEIETPRAQAGEPFAVVVRLTTRAGVPVPASRVRVTARGCAGSKQQLTCARAGEQTLVVFVEHGGAWIPFAHASVRVEPAPVPVRPVATVATIATAPRPSARGRWLGAFDAGIAGASRGIEGGVHRAWWSSAGIAFTLGGSARLSRTAMSVMAPVEDELTIIEPALGSDAGVMRSFRMGATWHVRASIGPLLVRQGARFGASDASSVALRVRGTAAAGVSVPFGSRAVVIGVGARRGVDLVAPAWHVPMTELFLEVRL